MTDERSIKCESMSLTESGNTKYFRKEKWNAESGELQILCQVHTKKNLVHYAEDYILFSKFLKITLPFVVDQSDMCVIEIILEMILKMN